MKKILLTLTAVTAMTFAANAQTEKGTHIVGGQIGFETSKVKDTDNKNNSFSIAPQYGYFVSDNFALGLGLGYSWDKAELGDKETTHDSFTLTPYGRYYAGNSNVKFFGQLSVPMAWGNEKIDGDKFANTANYGVELAPGVAYFPAPRVGIEFKVRGLYFESNSRELEADNAKVTSNSFGLDANSLAPTVGIQFHF